VPSQRQQRYQPTQPAARSVGERVIAAVPPVLWWL
jgi:hypothetical protein